MNQSGDEEDEEEGEDTRLEFLAGILYYIEEFAEMLYYIRWRRGESCSIIVERKRREREDSCLLRRVINRSEGFPLKSWLRAFLRH